MVRERRKETVRQEERMRKEIKLKNGRLGKKIKLVATLYTPVILLGI